MNMPPFRFYITDEMDEDFFAAICDVLEKDSYVDDIRTFFSEEPLSCFNECAWDGGVCEELWFYREDDNRYRIESLPEIFYEDLVEVFGL